METGNEGSVTSGSLARDRSTSIQSLPHHPHRPHITPDEECRQFSQLYKSQLVTGDEYAIIPYKWFESWMAYSGFDRQKADQGLASASSSSSSSVSSPNVPMEDGNDMGSSSSSATTLQRPGYIDCTGFLAEERERLGIRGLVPPRVQQNHAAALAAGEARVMARYWKIPTPIDKYSYLVALQDRNEVLFYRCLLDHIEKLAPIIYTPTVGEACQAFSAIFRRPRGMYFSYADRGAMHAMGQIIIETECE